jgi:hypothetical protein
MISSPKSNKSYSGSSKRCRTSSALTAGGLSEDYAGDEEIIRETEDDDNDIVLNFDDEFIKNLDSLLIKSEADLQRSKDLLANVKAHEDLCAKTVKELKNTKKSYIKVCTYSYYMNNIVPQLKSTTTLANATIVIATTATTATTAAATKNPVTSAVE